MGILRREAFRISEIKFHRLLVHNLGRERSAAQATILVSTFTDHGCFGGSRQASAPRLSRVPYAFVCTGPAIVHATADNDDAHIWIKVLIERVGPRQRPKLAKTLK